MLGFRRYVAVSWFFLAWCGNPGKGRALGCAEVKFVGEVFAKSDISEVYNSSKKNNKKGDTCVGLADGILLVDEKKRYIIQKILK